MANRGLSLKIFGSTLLYFAASFAGGVSIMPGTTVCVVSDWAKLELSVFCQ